MSGSFVDPLIMTLLFRELVGTRRSRKGERAIADAQKSIVKFISRKQEGRDGGVERN